jgi:hypothetical protein
MRRFALVAAVAALSFLAGCSQSRLEQKVQRGDVVASCGDSTFVLRDPNDGALVIVRDNGWTRQVADVAPGVQADEVCK